MLPQPALDAAYRLQWNGSTCAVAHCVSSGKWQLCFIVWLYPKEALPQFEQYSSHVNAAQKPNWIVVSRSKWLFNSVLVDLSCGSPERWIWAIDDEEKQKREIPNALPECGINFRLQLKFYVKHVDTNVFITREIVIINRALFTLSWTPVDHLGRGKEGIFVCIYQTCICSSATFE